MEIKPSNNDDNNNNNDDDDNDIVNLQFRKKVVIVHRGKYNYNISVNRLSHDVVT